MSDVLRCSLLLAGLLACSAPEEAKRVFVPVATDGAGLELVTNDLGYEVEVTRAAVVADDLKFAIAGEAHTSLLRRLSDAVVPVARAHPGHYRGGEVTGELPGHFVLSFVPGETEELGDATLLVGAYHSVNLTLTHAVPDDVGDDDSLLGHTAVLVGSARKGGQQLRFQALIDAPASRDIVGIPCDHRIDETSRGALVLRLMPHDALEGDTLFDGIDFAALDADGDAEVLIAPGVAAAVDAYNVLRRTLQTHDHFVVELVLP